MSESQSGQTGAGESLHIRDMWYTLLHSRWLVLGIMAAVVGLAALMTWRQSPVYESSATLRIDEQSRGQDVLGDLAPIAGYYGKGKIETEMIVLRSRRIAE